MLRIKSPIYLSILLTVSCVFLLQRANGQRIGLKAGAVVGNAYAVDADNLRTFTDPNFGFIAGLGYEQQFWRYFIWNASVDYQQQGFHYYQKDDRLTMKMGVLNVPVNFGFRVETSQRTSVFLHLGFYGQFHLHGKDEQGNALQWGGTLESFQPWDMGFNFGAGGDYGPWRLGFYYQTGFRDLDNQEEYTLKQYNYQLVLSYFFGTSRRDGLPKVLRRQPGKQRKRDWAKPNRKNPNHQMY
ncbi:outer membrane beta-barrel protein [Persicobacter sp. CCB-QB2]|uniref:outer membrane beta-barrel protein n=1 Tax=Persicobacter sp. CCB-QB2 TaxID=1561025 RepID=UPI0006A9C984|nr:outer membrane beta-barrel protein [Persicobacter sp. CCB-QB2]